MTWPKRDGSYSFLMHLGPFGCITTVIFSENAILSKPGFRIEITWPLPEPTWCNLTEFLQFSTHPKVPRVCGKLQKPNKIAPGGLCKRARFGSILFFRISDFICSFVQNPKNYKKYLSHEKTTPWYIYFDICSVEPLIFSKHIFF